MNPLMRLKRDKVEEVLMFEDEIMKLNKEEEEQRFSYRRRQARVILIPCICVSIMVGFVAQHHFTIDKKKKGIFVCPSIIYDEFNGPTSIHARFFFLKREVQMTCQINNFLLDDFNVLRGQAL